MIKISYKKPPKEMGSVVVHGHRCHDREGQASGTASGCIHRQKVGRKKRGMDVCTQLTFSFLQSHLQLMDLLTPVKVIVHSHAQKQISGGSRFHQADRETDIIGI